MTLSIWLPKSWCMRPRPPWASKGDIFEVVAVEVEGGGDVVADHA